MENCGYCGSSFKNRIGVNKHKSVCPKWIELLAGITKEKLEELYLVQLMSVEDIRKILGLSHQSTINRLFIKYGIKKRTFSEAMILSSDKRASTLLKKTGFRHNFCKGSPSRNKIEADLAKEGITNVFQREEVKRKSAETFIKKYGVKNAGEYSLKCKKHRVSSVHKIVLDILKEYGIEYTIELSLLNNNSYYSYDILIKDSNKIIEVNGDYWHGNPKIYKATDLILKGSSKELKVADKWKYDKKKIRHAKKQGYKVLVVWENDIKVYIEKITRKIIKYAKG